MSFGRAGSAAASSCSRCAMSLWRKICFSAWRLAHALDHRIVVPGVRQDEAIRHQLARGGNAGLVGDVARGKDQRRFLAVQIGEFALELDQRMIVAGDVAGAAGAGAHPGRGLHHGADDLGMLAHAEIVVRAPDHDVLAALAANARWRAESGRRFARDRRTRDSVVRRAAGQAPRRNRRCNPRGLLLRSVIGYGHRKLSRQGFDGLHTVVLEAFQGACRGPIAAARLPRH